MGVQSYIRNTRKRIQTDGFTGLKESAYPLYYTLLSQFTRFADSGRNIYEFDWDLLIVIDACRTDLLTEIADDYGFIHDIESYRSVASQTPYWMEGTFTPDHRDETQNTAYICGNPFSEGYLNSDDFERLEEVWRNAWVSPGTVPPRAVTDTTIEYCRSNNPDRVIAHYMQPHCPFISVPELSLGKKREKFGDQDWPDVWDRCRRGDITKAEVWDGYRSNLRIALDEIQLLLENVDAENALITSDHGNGIGEWGVYGHPRRQWIDELREVPLVRTTAKDEASYTPQYEFETADADRSEQLRALGYK